VTAVALRQPLEADLRRWLIATGLAAIGIPVSVVLHNLAYAFLAWLLGPETGDEPVFFLLATVVLPICLLIAATVSLYKLAPGFEN
jgi:O-antigen/teichoic acid export membrane protein